MVALPLTKTWQPTAASTQVPGWWEEGQANKDDPQHASFVSRTPASPKVPDSAVLLSGEQPKVRLHLSHQET